MSEANSFSEIKRGDIIKVDGGLLAFAVTSAGLVRGADEPDGYFRVLSVDMGKIEVERCTEADWLAQQEQPQ